MKPVDLLKVGPDKPLGYLPLMELDDPDGLKRQLETKGLTVRVLNEADAHVASGALVAYDRQALGGLLKSHQDVLTKSRWPEDPDKFVLHHMLHCAPFKTALFDLIADAYADRTNPYRRDSKSPIKVAMRYMKYGLLKACYSPLF